MPRSLPQRSLHGRFSVVVLLPPDSLLPPFFPALSSLHKHNHAEDIYFSSHYT